MLQQQFEEDMDHWLRQDPRTARRIWELMQDVKRSPFSGIGKPEPLKGWGENVWSRRINETDRLVYAVFDDRIDFLQARYHYVPERLRAANDAAVHCASETASST